MPRPTFADPKTDFIFKRIFGSETHKHLLIKLLNVLLELEEGQLIQDLSYLNAEEKIPREELKLSIVDVRCIDEQGTQYVVEMQLFNVAGFEERIIYNASKAFTLQLKTAEDYNQLKGVVGVTICDFCLWPDKPEPGAFTLPVGGATGDDTVPMLSRWRMHEQHSGLPGLPQVQYVFLELPKYTAGAHPTELVDKWALFFRDAENFDVIPPELDEDPFREAFEVARIVHLSDAEYEFYEGQKMKEQDERGMLVKARKEGEEEGRRQETEARVAAERRTEEAAEACRQETEARVAAERRAEKETEARRQASEERATAEAQLREAMAEIQRLKGTSPND